MIATDALLDTVADAAREENIATARTSAAMLSFVRARREDAAAAGESRAGVEDAGQLACDEIAVALEMPSNAVQSRVYVAGLLADHLPAVAAAHADGTHHRRMPTGTRVPSRVHLHRRHQTLPRAESADPRSSSSGRESRRRVVVSIRRSALVPRRSGYSTTVARPTSRPPTQTQDRPTSGDSGVVSIRGDQLLRRGPRYSTTEKWPTSGG